MPAIVDMPFTPSAHRAIERVTPAFPWFVEDRFVLLGANRSHALHAPHVVNAIHDFLPGFGSPAFAVPIIESRVTSAASSSSFRLCVPAGRSGTTRYLISAVRS